MPVNAADNRVGDAADLSDAVDSPDAPDAVDGALELVALGTSGSWPSAGRACSGYLVSVAGRREAARHQPPHVPPSPASGNEADADDGGDAPADASAVSILVDAGNGSTSNLQRLVQLDELDAVFISHRHPDHWADLIGMFHALRLDPRLQRDPVPLYAPADVPSAVARMLSDSSVAQFDAVFDVRAVTAGDVVTVPAVDGGGLEIAVEIFPAVHSVPAISFRFSALGRTIAYSGDTAEHPGLIECASHADVLLCEATWQGLTSSYPAGVHLTAADAGSVATRAQVDRLVLTHVSGGLDTSVSWREAQATFEGPIDVAADLNRWTLPAR